VRSGTQLPMPWLLSAERARRAVSEKCNWRIFADIIHCILLRHYNDFRALAASRGAISQQQSNATRRLALPRWSKQKKPRGCVDRLLDDFPIEPTAPHLKLHV